MAGPSKSAKKSKIIVLKITSQLLSQFPVTTSTSDSTVKSENATPSAQQVVSEEKSSEDNGTPASNNDAVQDNATPGGAPEVKKKRPPPNPNARKRAPPAIDPDAPMRDKSRPGPKKRSRGAGDAAKETEAKAAAPNAAAAHKLGPKANTGAINAGLRALDRSGKPCRRWEKKGLQLKSFTGSSWHMPTWKGSQRPNLNADGEVQSDSSSEIKPLDASGIASEKSASAMDIGEADTTLMNGIESSPAPPVAA